MKTILFAIFLTMSILLGITVVGLTLSPEQSENYHMILISFGICVLFVYLLKDSIKSVN